MLPLLGLCKKHVTELVSSGLRFRSCKKRHVLILKVCINPLSNVPHQQSRCPCSTHWLPAMLLQSTLFECCSQEDPPRKYKCSLLFPTQLLNQVLNRVTAERNLFDRVVNLRLPGGSVH